MASREVDASITRILRDVEEKDLAPTPKSITFGGDAHNIAQKYGGSGNVAQKLKFVPAVLAWAIKNTNRRISDLIPYITGIRRQIEAHNFAASAQRRNIVITIKKHRRVLVRSSLEPFLAKFRIAILQNQGARVQNHRKTTVTAHLW